MNEQMREAFEKWIGTFRSGSVPDEERIAWEAWQAASSRCADRIKDLEHGKREAITLAKETLDAAKEQGMELVHISDYHYEPVNVRAVAAESEVARLKALLGGLVELCDMHGFSFGQYETVFDEDEQRQEFSCHGCAATAVAYWPKWDVKIEHEPSCTTLAIRAALTVGEKRKEEA